MCFTSRHRKHGHSCLLKQKAAGSNFFKKQQKRKYNSELRGAGNDCCMVLCELKTSCCSKQGLASSQCATREQEPTKSMRIGTSAGSSQVLNLKCFSLILHKMFNQKPDPECLKGVQWSSAHSQKQQNKCQIQQFRVYTFSLFSFIGKSIN